MSVDLAHRSLRAVWHPCTQMQRAAQYPPLGILSGQGPWLFDESGHRYFDANSSWWVNLFGHADARINAALKDQLDRLPHVMLAGCTHAPAVELAERLSTLTGGVLGHCFFGSDGASAVEIALKMSFHFWRNSGHPAKQEFVCLRQSYHGETLGALAVTDVAVFRDVYDPLLMRAHQVMSPDARQAAPGESPTDVALRAAQELKILFETRHNRIAALILEPLVQGATGMAMHDPAYLRAARALCDEYQVHLIADEIAVGYGRTGTFFAFEQAALPGDMPIWPDLLCLSKGISGGYLPLSLVLSRDAVYGAFLDDDVARGFLHSHSYTGNALACRAALAVLDRFEEDQVLQANRQRATILSDALTPLRDDPRIQHFRQTGMIWAFDVREAFAGSRFAERFHLAGRARELLIRPIGRTVYLMPPYLLDASMSAWLAKQVSSTLDDVLQGPLLDVDRPSEPATA
ncbi:Adenosylmethionine-8-amino-7-oxononanoate aminotransferase [Thiomonas arsenitoxydans]|uniref:Adenosylmethionine-8-amino-7-oxononanoate aminotransferase n=1 Tax=Thiomonas arsenitoxydans (strain DSM 22701 / CIP 110005 / 3As) TaxID=426114 RepID=D6CUM2_THIA3|nr:adenosylmethionine--8-amino-7-oxononanoate transaminase [Thiomonas arsenitoxydans]MDE2267671.1 adenosylmethionine--8-amino-7-oxononanoate transaminase [Betaproteobacteria bacterium]OZB55473.1 MAG: aspartate aminotransferase family protein [Thiomonas sp. 15-63-373]CQR45049.1 Adenosylmethionine-8-amino-7-oxononanoate aminotransferase [Thiomonas sp. CB3]CAZ88991.1 Adenosylmethionine-8-amino-7-oxononanoate aminotransferase (7,8-diamino-pelargonic acid aminotransferase) (DAPA aminotransferase) [T